MVLSIAKDMLGHANESTTLKHYIYTLNSQISGLITGISVRISHRFSTWGQASS